MNLAKEMGLYFASFILHHCVLLKFTAECSLLKMKRLSFIVRLQGYLEEFCYITPKAKKPFLAHFNDVILFPR